MFKRIVQRLMALVPVLFIVSVLTFSFTSLLPSDPVDLIIGDLGTQEQYDMVRERLGLNEPVVLLGLIHKSEPTRHAQIWYAVLCL